MRKIQTSAQVITSAFIRILLILLVVNIVVVSAVVFHNEMAQKRAEGLTLLKNISSSSDLTKINWDEFHLSDGSERRADYVRVENQKSPGTNEFLSGDFHDLGNYRFTNEGVFVYSKFTSNGRIYEVWVNVNNVLESVSLTIAAIIAVMIFTAGISLFFIRRTSLKISQPLSNLAADVENNHIRIPENPAEVTKVAENFNALLTRLNQKIAQERQFTSDASHELRTPVAAIRGHVKLLKRRAQQHPEILEASLNYIDDESVRMKNLIENLLALSREEEISVKNEHFELTTFLQQKIADLQAVILQKIVVKSDEKVWIDNDNQIIGQILTSLIENASKYSPENSEIIIALSSSASPANLDDSKRTSSQESVGTLTISVSDNGSGISDEEKTKIFDRFYRIDKSRNSEIPGSGLGLSISKNLATTIGAEIFVTDNQPNGSIFHLRLK